MTSRSTSELFAEFMLAIAVDDVPAARAATGRVFRGYDFADITDAEYEPSLQLGAWPVVEQAAGFGAYEWVLSAWHTAPTYFVFASDGGDPMRVDVMQAEGGALPDGQSVVGVVVRTE